MKPAPVPRVAVVGSFVLDLVVRIPRLPHKGETLFADDFELCAGGKGFNQAVTAARCGARVAMVGALGDDEFGQVFTRIMEREAIDARFVVRLGDTGTSLGIPMVAPSGENWIIGVRRANTRLTAEDVHAASEVIESGRILLLQLEVPLEVCREAARVARGVDAAVILNPAPAHLPSGELFPAGVGGADWVDWLVPNETEVEGLLGLTPGSIEAAFARGQSAGLAAVRAAAESLRALGVRRGVVITLGARGAFAGTESFQALVPAHVVRPVDATGAGDAFCGAFAVAMAEDRPLEECLAFANAAGALCVTRRGAEPSLPTRAEVEGLAAHSPARAESDR